MNRTPFQGVYNIIRFNRHLYLLALATIVLLPLAVHYLPRRFAWPLMIVAAIAFLSMMLSLLISHYIYDRSGIYELPFLDVAGIHPDDHMLNIHAGFDETSAILAAKYPGATLTVLDFYNPQLHTEISVKRARLAYPAYKNTIHIDTSFLPFPDASVGHILLTFSAHEIRQQAERENFFSELRRVLRADGVVILTEQLRDLPNFIAYNIGAFHFLPEAAWLRTFKESGLQVYDRIMTTPFITTIMLKKHGTAP